MTAPAFSIDVRAMAPHDRHGLIFSSFDALARGQAMELVNDHDPGPLRRQFEARMPGQSAWTYLEQGPATWRVAITRVKPTHGDAGSCCGGCGGH